MVYGTQFPEVKKKGTNISQNNQDNFVFLEECQISGLSTLKTSLLSFPLSTYAAQRKWKHEIVFSWMSHCGKVRSAVFVHLVETQQWEDRGSCSFFTKQLRILVRAGEPCGVFMCVQDQNGESWSWLPVWELELHGFLLYWGWINPKCPPIIVGLWKWV